MDSHVSVHDIDVRADISPERVSQELDEVIHSYESMPPSPSPPPSGAVSYANASFEDDDKIKNGSINENNNNRRKKRGKDMKKEMENLVREQERATEIAPKSPGRRRNAKDYLKIVVIAVTILVFVLNVGPFNRFEGNPLFNQTRGQASRKYKLALTPVPIVFRIIWPVIYVFQGLWMGLCIVAIFTKTKKFAFIDGTRHSHLTYLHLYPDVFPVTALISYILGQLGITAYKFVHDKEELLFSFVCLIISSVFFHFSLIFAVRAVHRSRQFMVPEIVEAPHATLLRCFVWALYLFYINGIAILATWQLVASAFSLDKYLLYSLLWKPEVATTIAVCVVDFYVVVYFVIDVFAVGLASRTLFASYLALLAASIGTVMKLYVPGLWRNPSDVTRIQAVFVVVVATVAILAKIVVLVASGTVKKCRGRQRRQSEQDSASNGITNL